jgi:hypothetical protein
MNPEDFPAITVKHAGAASSAFGRLALFDQDIEMACTYVVEEAETVIANSRWDYRHASIEPTRLDNDFHSFSPSYKALFDRRHEYVEHDVSGSETLQARDLREAALTLSNRGNLGKALIRIVRSDWGNTDITLTQAASRQALAAAEPLPLDENITFDILSDIIQQTGVDPREMKELYSLEDLFVMLTIRSPEVELTRTLSVETDNDDLHNSKVAIVEKTKQTPSVRPTVTHSIGALSTLHYQTEPDVTLSTSLYLATHAKPPLMSAGVDASLQLPGAEHWSRERREEVMQNFIQPFLDPKTFITTMHGQMEMALKASKQ